MTHNVWLEKHPYLRPVAEFHNAIQVTVASVLLPAMCIPAWDEYVSDFNLGIPLLQSHNVALDFAPLATPILTVIRMLQSKSLPGRLPEEARELYADLQEQAGGSDLLVNSLLRKCSFTLKRPGLFYHLGWSVMARSLSDLVNDFGLWRQEEGWLRSYCPTCGALPAMAQLIGFEHGRARLLCCGYCSTHWNYPRAGCPFCGNADDQRLGYLGLEGEAALRIDYCKDCGGYLKTYNGEGREALFLADWTSLHLDIIARDRGLNRFAESLYQL